MNRTVNETGLNLDSGTTTKTGSLNRITSQESSSKVVIKGTKTEF